MQVLRIGALQSLENSTEETEVEQQMREKENYKVAASWNPGGKSFAKRSDHLCQILLVYTASKMRAEIDDWIQQLRTVIGAVLVGC